MAQGRDNAKNFLTENPDIFKEIHDKVIAKLNGDKSENEKDAAKPAESAGAANVPEEKAAPKKRISIDVAVDD